MYAEVGRFTTLVGLTARTTLSSRKGAVTWIVALLPLYVIGGLLAYGSQVTIEEYQEIVVPLFINIVLIVTALIHGSRLLKEEVDDNTLVYLTTRRISKASLVAYKFIGYYASSLLILLPPLIISYLLVVSSAGTPIGQDAPVLWALMSMGAVGSAAYGGLFLMMGFVLKRPLFVGLLYGFLWESIALQLPGDVPLISISHYLWSIGSNLVEVGMLSQYRTSLDLLWSVLIPLLICLGAIIITYILVLTREVSSRE